MSGPFVFIRNDDVWTLDPDFRFFAEQAVDNGIPVVYAVIPMTMEKELVRFLCKAKEKNPCLLDIVQHGLSHHNYATPEDARKYEFGAGRSLGQQQEDIQQGQAKMRRAFGDLFTPAFVPPYHGYDQNTIRVLNQQPFEIFSAGPRSTGGIKKNMMEIPATVSFSRYDEGNVFIQRAGDVITRIIKDSHGRSLVGVVTHHADFATAGRRVELQRFFKGIAALKVRKELRVCLFSEILLAARKRALEEKE